MTKVTFEVASLASACAQAAKVAPTRGEAFEKAAGMLLDVTKTECIVMATDGLVRFSTWLTPEGFEGDKDQVVWRLPARLFADVVGKLKVGRHRTLTLEQDGSVIKMVHGTTRATFILMDATRYHRWTPFSPDDMTEVTGLAKAVAQVIPCALKGGDPPMIGVYLDGEAAIATDRYKFASSPLKIDLKEPVLIPPAAITSVLRNSSTVMLRVDGNQVCIMPDEYTQIVLTAYGVPYIPVEKVLRRDWPITGQVSKQVLIEAIDLVTEMSGGTDRLPKVLLIFGREQIAAMMVNEEHGRIGHVFDVPGQFTFPVRREIYFLPDNLLIALNGCIGDVIEISFDPSNPYFPIYFKGAEGSEFWLAPRQKSEPGDAS